MDLVEKYLNDPHGGCSGCVDEAKGASTQMQCMECMKKFKKKIGPRTFEVKCPKCGSYDTEPV